MNNKTVAVTTTRQLFSFSSRARLKNNGTDPVYIGGPSVTADATATGGYQLAANESIDIPDGEDVYVILATSKTATLSILNPI